MRRAGSLLLATLLAACGDAPAPPPVTIEVPIAPPARVPALTPALLAEAHYRVLFDEEAEVVLHEGRYRREDPRLSVTLHPRLAQGDLDDDGVPDAAVVLMVDGGGSGTFYELAVVLDRAGTPTYQTSVMLGDRIDFESMRISDGDIVVRYRDHGPQDPSCCPTVDRLRAFALAEDGLVDVTLPDEGQGQAL